MRKLWNRKTIIIPVAAMFLLACGLLVVFLYQETDVPHAKGNSVSIVGKEYTLEIADTDNERSFGLGERDSLCSSCAMLFVFDRPAAYAFWMKGMRFPIDIVWLLGGEVVHIERRIPADARSIYTPARPADRVLEFNAGATDGLFVGDKVESLP